MKYGYLIYIAREKNKFDILVKIWYTISEEKTMSEEYISRNEFNGLKQEVQELKEEVSEYKTLLMKIDKKIDVIGEKIANGEKIDELKLQPLEKRVTKLEENQSWLWKLCASIIITGIIGAIITFK